MLYWPYVKKLHRQLAWVAKDDCPLLGDTCELLDVLVLATFAVLRLPVVTVKGRLAVVVLALRLVNLLAPLLDAVADQVTDAVA